MSSFPELPGILEQPVVEEAVLDDTGLSLVVHNDEVNTFDWVIESLVKICRHSMEQAEQCAYIIHFNGKYAVKHGEERELNPMRRGLVDRGINATLE
jgi:ATP-dependent Clp protease adaptor protein ClpS